jgi:hypothetical protein
MVFIKSLNIGFHIFGVNTINKIYLCNNDKGDIVKIRFDIDC